MVYAGKPNQLDIINHITLMIPLSLWLLKNYIHWQRITYIGRKPFCGLCDHPQVLKGWNSQVVVLSVHSIWPGSILAVVFAVCSIWPGFILTDHFANQPFNSLLTLLVWLLVQARVARWEGGYTCSTNEGPSGPSGTHNGSCTTVLHNSTTQIIKICFHTRSNIFFHNNNTISSL